MMKKFFTPRWLLTSLLVFAAAVVMILLGLWQLDRLGQRRSFNTRVTAQLQAVPLDLNSQFPVDLNTLPDLEYHSITVAGNFDFSQEILLRNKDYQNAPGFRVLTPLHINGNSYSILVDRGWIPLKMGQSASADPYAEPVSVTLKGVIRRSETEPAFGGVPDPTLGPGQARLAAWNFIDLQRIAQQVSYPILPVYIQEAPEAERSDLPIRSVDLPVLDEGPHLGYALQWFSFTVILLLGYPFFVRRNLQKSNKALLQMKQ